LQKHLISIWCIFWKSIICFTKLTELITLSLSWLCTFTREVRVDRSETLTLDSIRLSLIRQEDSIIFSLLERAQYGYNANTYDSSAFPMDGFEGSLAEYIVEETEKLHAQVNLTSN
jgi:hypothetical protein